MFKKIISSAFAITFLVPAYAMSPKLSEFCSNIPKPFFNENLNNSDAMFKHADGNVKFKINREESLVKMDVILQTFNGLKRSLRSVPDKDLRMSLARTSQYYVNLNVVAAQMSFSSLIGKYYLPSDLYIKLGDAVTAITSSSNNDEELKYYEDKLALAHKITEKLDPILANYAYWHLKSEQFIDPVAKEVTRIGFCTNAAKESDYFELKKAFSLVKFDKNRKFRNMNDGWSSNGRYDHLFKK